MQHEGAKWFTPREGYRHIIKGKQHSILGFETEKASWVMDHSSCTAPVLIGA